MASFVRLSSVTARQILRPNALRSKGAVLSQYGGRVYFSSMPSKARAEARDEYKKHKETTPPSVSNDVEKLAKEITEEAPKRRRLSEVRMTLLGELFLAL